MRFIVDECTGPAVACWLQEHQHDADNFVVVTETTVRIANVKVS